MLVLSRKETERIVVGHNIEVIVLAVRGGKVRLGIIAPEDVSIHRAEVRPQITSEKSDRLVRADICP